MAKSFFTFEVHRAHNGLILSVFDRASKSEAREHWIAKDFKELAEFVVADMCKQMLGDIDEPNNESIDDLLTDVRKKFPGI